jgi:hypothetical protein
MLNKEYHSIRIGFIRRCRMSGDKVVVDSPILWGRGFVFDRHRLTASLYSRFLGIPISKREVPFSHITNLQVREVVENPFWQEAGMPGYLFFAVIMKLVDFREELKIAKIQFSKKNKEEAKKRAEWIETVIRSATGISLQEETKQAVYWIGVEMCGNVTKKPGISHTELLGSVQGSNDLKELAIGQLVKHAKFKSLMRDSCV